jgi:hypothetical protein
MPTSFLRLTQMENHHIKMNAISDLTDYDFQDLDFKNIKLPSSQ